MKARLRIFLSKNETVVTYRGLHISLMKYILSNYSKELFNKYYGNKGEAKTKPLCFAVDLPGFKKVGKETVQLSTNEIYMTISYNDDVEKITEAIALAVQDRLSIKFGDNKMVIANYRIIPNKILLNDTNVAVYDILSPICLREHDFKTRNNYNDKYVRCDDEDFVSALKDSLKRNLLPKYNDITEQDINNLIVHTKECKPTVVKHYERYCRVTCGKIGFTGDVKVLRAIQREHIGSQRPSGFGFLNLITQM